MKTTNFGKPFKPYAAAGVPTADVARESRSTRPIAMLNITRTITEHIPMLRDPDSIGLSIGSVIDNHLRASAKEYAMIQTVALEFEPDDWLELARQLRGDDSDDDMPVRD